MFNNNICNPHKYFLSPLVRPDIYRLARHPGVTGDIGWIILRGEIKRRPRVNAGGARLDRPVRRQRVRRPGFPGDRDRLPYLGNNLILAPDPRAQSCRNLHQVARRVLAGQREKRSRKRRVFHPRRAAEQLSRLLPARAGQVQLANPRGLTAAGTYEDRISGNKWQVTQSQIIGETDSLGIAVLYRIGQ